MVCMTFMPPQPDVLIPLRRSVSLLYAQAAAVGRDDAADRLDDALAAIGAPVFLPRPPLVLDDQFPAQLFHSATASLERAAGSKAVDTASLIECWGALRAARTLWQRPQDGDQPR
jgi:hypothetical protein